MLAVSSLLFLATLFVPIHTILGETAATAATAPRPPLALTSASRLASPRMVSITNTTNTTNDVYETLGVRKPSPTPFGLNRWSWKVHGKILPILHYGDAMTTPDVCVNLRVLWCKALSSVDPTSVAYEGLTGSGNNGSNSSNNSNKVVVRPYGTYRILPPLSRWVLWYFWWLFPRWMHANIELRTAYLQRAIRIEIDRMGSTTTTTTTTKKRKSCLVILGGGYDPRGSNLLAGGIVDRVYELDLPQVITAKRRLLHARGFLSPNLTPSSSSDTANNNNNNLRLLAVDLNDADALDSVLDEIQSDLSTTDVSGGAADDDDENNGEWNVVFLSEALFLYLDRGVPGRILEQISSRRFGPNGGISLVFADRFDDIDTMGTKNDGGNDSNDPDGSLRGRLNAWLNGRGWVLQDFMSKPGATRHLGMAIAR